ncbi:hypothetical protein ACLOJK_024344 [Asimina triloba]
MVWVCHGDLAGLACSAEAAMVTAGLGKMQRKILQLPSLSCCRGWVPDLEDAGSEGRPTAGCRVAAMGKEPPDNVGL